jgi:glycine dehydrogenase
MKIIPIGTDEHGNIKLDEVKEKAEKFSDKLSCMMITYPSTHGVFESEVKEICDLVHLHGG